MLSEKAEQNFLERTETRMLRWMMGIRRSEKNRDEEIRARVGVVNISEKIKRIKSTISENVEIENSILFYFMFSHFYVGSMNDDIRLHVARSYTTSADSPFSLISSFTSSNQIQNSMRRSQTGKRQKKKMNTTSTMREYTITTTPTTSALQQR